LPARAPRGRGHGRSHRRQEFRRVPAGGQSPLRADGADGRALRVGHMSQAIQEFYSQFLGVIHHIGWIEAIDVVVVALVLYQLLRLLRGTQGTQVLVARTRLAATARTANRLTPVLPGGRFRTPPSSLSIPAS